MSDNGNEPAGEEDAKKPKLRSPNHPTLTLSEAIDKATLLHNKYGKHAAGIADALSTLNYTSKSSSGAQCIATLSAFGLISLTGKGSNRKVAVSDMADRIIREAPDRKKLIQEAALLPSVHQEVWSEFQSQGLPHDDILRTHLVWERPEGSRFTEEAVGGFIEQFRATLTYAG